MASDILRSQEGILQRELTGLRTQLSALDTRGGTEFPGAKDATRGS